MLDAVRYQIGRRLYYLGWRIMPAQLRNRLSQINDIGLQWVENDFPTHFTISMNEKCE